MIYITNDEVNLPDKSTLDEIRNPVEKEIVCQIIQKIEDFTNNVENIRQEIQMQFPKI